MTSFSALSQDSLTGRWMRWLAALLLVAAPATPAWELGGHLKYQYTHTHYRPDDMAAVIGDPSADDHGLDARLKAEHRAGAWDFVAHYELLAIAGDTLETRRQLATLGLVRTGTTNGLPDDSTRLFDLTDEITDSERRAAVQRLDRLSVGYTGNAGVVRFGRQALSWGNGLVFNPLDFVNPFSPIAIDKDYKTGDDMLFAQLTAGAGDVQGIVLPRRDAATHEVESAESTYSAKLRLRRGGYDLDFIAALHFDETLAGLGVVRSVGGAVWRLDLGYTDTESGEDVWSLVTNLDYSWTWFERNFYGYAEYFHNGFGEGDPARYATPNPELAARIARGELFTLARDYAAVGGQIELTPLLNLYANLIRNLDDASHFVQLRGAYDWTQDLQLMAGLNWPMGERGDEYGGIPLPGIGAYLTPGRAVYARVAYYF
jgi:hypothetical protein